MSKRKKTDPEFEPEVIDEDWGDDHFLAFVPNQIEANDNYDQHLLGFPHNILFGGMALGNAHPNPPTALWTPYSAIWQGGPGPIFQDSSGRNADCLLCYCCHMVYNGVCDEAPNEHLREQRAEARLGKALSEDRRASRRTDSPRH